MLCLDVVCHSLLAVAASGILSGCYWRVDHDSHCLAGSGSAPVGYLDVQAEKQKAAAIKAAQERAAQDYEREVQQLNAMKLQNEARINEKVRKAKQKARKKEEAVHTDEVSFTIQSWPLLSRPLQLGCVGTSTNSSFWP